MHEVVYSPITYEHFYGERNIPGAKLSFLCIEISFHIVMHENETFMHDIFMPHFFHA